MYPDDRVLVGTVKRKRDLAFAREAHWYRIPQAQMPRGVNTEYIAFFLSKSILKDQESGIYYFARRAGLELAYRHQLLPTEADHARANSVYYKVQLDDLREKTPPILNPTHRRFSFIYTTWDRFVHAQQISDLYSTADYYVDRVYHALRSSGVRPERFWEVERSETDAAPQLRILCQNGTVIASTEVTPETIFLDAAQEDDAILAKIRAEIARQGGPVMVNIPLDD
jgi:hypothetical protein